MNVQFSLSANVSPSLVQSEGATNAVNTSTSSPSNASSTVKDIKEMTKMESRGVSFSVGQEQLIRAIERAVKALEGPQTTLDISIHNKTHDIMVKVLNKDTGEIIREIPPEKTLDLVAKMMELAGILIDEKI